MAGYHDKARLFSSQAVAEAKALGHPHNRAFALGFASFLHEFCGEVSRVAELAEEQSALCREYGIPYWQSWAEMLKGWVLVRSGIREQAAGHRRPLSEPAGEGPGAERG
jgi:hypothetical protein